jgi:crotonobetainyl-CoA:carnitine CoA-transferase CaiB-like acyl-CoA transferase
VKDGWVAVCCVTDEHRDAMARALGLGGDGTPGGAAGTAFETGSVEGAVASLTVVELMTLLRDVGVPAAPSVHPSAVPDDAQVVARQLLRHYRHPAAGRFVQVGIPLTLSVDAPAVKGPAPTPAPVRRRVPPTAAKAGR